jgi:hypothetical protein
MFAHERTDRRHVPGTQRGYGAAISNITGILDASKNATISGFNAPSATSSIGQNGSARADQLDQHLSRRSVVATFGAGRPSRSRSWRANFNNPNGLLRSDRTAGDDAAGLPSIGTAGTGGRGTLVGSALECPTSTSPGHEHDSVAARVSGELQDHHDIDQLLVDSQLKQ